MKIQLDSPPRQWFAVRKYGVKSCLTLLTKDPVQSLNPPPLKIIATDLTSSAQSTNSGQFTLLLHVRAVECRDDAYEYLAKWIYDIHTCKFIYMI